MIEELIEKPKRKSGVQGKRPPRQGNTLTRADLSESVYKVIGTTRTEASQIVDTVIAQIVDTICTGETVKLHNFGKFVIRQKDKREGRNPRTLEPAEISERKIVQFKPSPAFRDQLNPPPPKNSAKTKPAK